MRFHVLSLPHTQTTLKYSCCAYTEKVRKFCNMMMDRGHTVYLYAGEKNQARCTELITCISEKDRAAAVPTDKHYVEASFDPNLHQWQTYNANAIAGIFARREPHDFLCSIAGYSHKMVADFLSDMMFVEFGIGYQGTIAKYRVFESYAWMHAMYGWQQEPHKANGIWFDAVIPNYFEPELFPFQPKKKDYFLYLGRLVERKGYKIAAEVCQKLGKKLILAGPAPDGPPTYGKWIGPIGPAKRAKLLGDAAALFCPTIYVEPFGGVAVEAMMCGTPVICTDWGAFTETVIEGVTGFRCRTFKEFCDAAENVGKLSPQDCCAHAVSRYSTTTVSKDYENYFERLTTLWRGGWYEM